MKNNTITAATTFRLATQSDIPGLPAIERSAAQAFRLIPHLAWLAKDGTARPSLDLVADEVASTTPRPRKRKETPASQPGGDPFGDLPGAGDVDWLGA